MECTYFHVCVAVRIFFKAAIKCIFEQTISSLEPKTEANFTDLINTGPFNFNTAEIRLLIKTVSFILKRRDRHAEGKRAARGSVVSLYFPK